MDLLLVQTERHCRQLNAVWQPSENNRRAKYYRLTRAGRKQLGEETDEWNRIADAIARDFDTLGVPLVSGRDFQTSDRAGPQAVAARCDCLRRSDGAVCDGRSCGVLSTRAASRKD